MLIALITVGCRKADVRTAPSPPPPKDRETGEVVFGCGPEAEYKGGMAEWLKFLSSNLIYPDTAVNAEVQGKIRVSFTIEKDGKVSNVEALDGPGMLRGEAVRVISLSSGRWQPASPHDRANSGAMLVS